MGKPIENTEDLIDSRDVIARIAELEQIACDGTPDCPYHGEDDCEMGDGGEADELEALKALAEEGEASPDWAYGETLVRDSYVRTYAEQLAEDLGMIHCNLSDWPMRHIDWASAADEMLNDYLPADFDGVTYWIRA